MPWNAAFATVLVATLVAVLWQREPVPGARLDSEEPRANAPKFREVSPPPPSGAAAPLREAASPVAPPPPSITSPSTSFTLPAKPSAPPAEAPAASVAPRPETVPKAQRVPPPTAPPVAEPVAPRRDAADAARSASPAVPAIPAARPAPSVDSAGRFAPPDALASRARNEQEASANQRSGAAAQLPAPATQGAAQGAAPGAAPAPARPAAPSTRTEASEPPTFAALSQWNRLTISRRGGESHSVSRAEAGELSALLGSAALSAAGAQPLTASPEWRVTLERNGNVLAVFEVAAAQVRWREGPTPPATGMPSAPALSALREALRTAVQKEEAPRAPNAVQPEAASPSETSSPSQSPPPQPEAQSPAPQPGAPRSP